MKKLPVIMDYGCVLIERIISRKVVCLICLRHLKLFPSPSFVGIMAQVWGYGSGVVLDGNSPW